MENMRKLGLGLCASLFATSLFSFGPTFGVYRLLSTPDPLKTALNESGMYQSFVTNALEQAQKEQPETGEEIPLGRPEVQAIIRKAASPQALQGQVEGALDALYAWLQGKTPRLEFSVQLGAVQQNLADELAVYVEKRLNELPPCKKGSEPRGTIDPFSTNCLPRGAKPSRVAAETKKQIVSGELMESSTITPSDMTAGSGQSLEQQLKALPKAYQIAKWTAYGTGALIILAGAATILLNVSRRAGLRRVAISAVMVGTVSALLAWLAGYGVGRAQELANPSAPLAQTGVQVGQHLANHFVVWWLWYGIGLVAFGVMVLVVLYFTKPKSVLPVASTDQKPTGPIPRPKGTPKVNAETQKEEKQN